jgi:hypothetical protein
LPVPNQYNDANHTQGTAEQVESVHVWSLVERRNVVDNEQRVAHRVSSWLCDDTLLLVIEAVQQERKRM